MSELPARAARAAPAPSAPDQAAGARPRGDRRGGDPRARRDGLDGGDVAPGRRRARGGAASLYAYVESKDVLVELMLDQVLGEIDVSDLPDERPWQEQIKDLIRRARTPRSPPTATSRGPRSAASPPGANALGQMEMMLAVLRAVGPLGPGGRLRRRSDRPGRRCRRRTRTASSPRPGSASTSSSATSASSAATSSRCRPTASRTSSTLAGPLTRVSPDEDERFEFMLNVIVDGLAAQR